MYHSTSFCAAGSAILFLMSVASWVFALRARSMASFTSARSPVSGAKRWPPWEQAKPSTASACVVRKRVWRADFFRTQRCDEGEPPSPACDFLVASCAFWACGLWLARAVASVEKRASPASVKKQDSERKHRFIPWSPCETHVTNTVKTKRSRDAVALNCSKDTTTPEVQLSLLRNKRAQNEADGTQKFRRRRGIAFDRGRSGRLAGLNAADIGALNDPAVRKQLENLGLQMPPQDKLAPEALGARQKAEIAKWWPMIKAATRQGGL